MQLKCSLPYTNDFQLQHIVFNKVFLFLFSTTNIIRGDQIFQIIFKQQCVYHFEALVIMYDKQEYIIPVILTFTYHSINTMIFSPEQY